MKTYVSWQEFLTAKDWIEGSNELGGCIEEKEDPSENPDDPDPGPDPETNLTCHEAMLEVEEKCHTTLEAQWLEEHCSMIDLTNYYTECVTKMCIEFSNDTLLVILEKVVEECREVIDGDDNNDNNDDNDENDNDFGYQIIYFNFLALMKFKILQFFRPLFKKSLFAAKFQDNLIQKMMTIIMMIMEKMMTTLMMITEMTRTKETIMMTTEEVTMTVLQAPELFIYIIQY